MEKKVNQFLYFFLLINSINNLLCGEEEIDHCVQCGTGENFETCFKCEDKYFPFMSNVLCLPCDNPLYGMYGCGGNCDATNYVKTRNVICEENACKEGYYNIEGMCIPCSKPVPYCGKCTYAPPVGINSNETVLKHFSCDKCINNQFKLENNRCYHCFLWKCAICHFEPNNRAVCDKCITNYYVNSSRLCSECYWVGIIGGKCKVCSDNRYNYEYCYCYSFYTKNAQGTCISCPANCAQCSYDSLKNNFTCYRCGIGYTLNNLGKCVSCGFKCDFCYLDNNQQPICTSCSLGYRLNEDNNCLNCPENCKSCKKVQNDEIICTSCFGYYGINIQKRCEKCPIHCHSCFWKPEKNEFGCSYCYKDYEYSHQNHYIEGKDDKCVRCQDIDEIGGEGCIECSYNKYLDKEYKCTRCLGDTNGFWKPINAPNKDYANVRNIYKCLSNKERTPKNLHGCLEAKYDSTKNIYECSRCKSGFIPVYNEKSCRIPSEIDLSNNCYSAEYIEEKQFYSCLSCSTVSIVDHLGKTDCFKAVDELIRCSRGTKDENGKFQCTQCIHNYQFMYSYKFNQNICDDKCDIESFYKWSWCYKCDDLHTGNPGCDREYGCTYSWTNDELDCNKCKDSYFKYTQGQCFSCFKENIGCKKCNLDTTNKKFICEECSDGYILNSYTQKCEIITCDEYPEVMNGCIICTDKINEYLSQNKCQACKEGFFKTRDESCIYCKARTIGGPSCQQCEYYKDENGNETNEIRCKYCPPDSALSSDGKCYNCQEELGEGCTKCSFIKDEENNTEKLQCQNCKNNYNLSQNRHCIHYQSYYQIIPHCAKSYYNIILNDFNNFTNNFSDNPFENNNDNSDNPFENNNDNSDNPSGNNNDNRDSHFENNNDNSDTLNDNEFERSINETNNNELNINPNNFRIESICQECKNGYYRTDEGKCESLGIEECSFFSMLTTAEYNKYYSCKNFCENKNYAKINYYLDDILNKFQNKSYSSNDFIPSLNLNTSNNFSNGIYNNSNLNLSLDDYLEEENIKTILDLDQIIIKYNINNKTLFLLDDDLKSLIAKGYLCLGNSGNGEKNQPKSLKKCKISEYIESNDSYSCLECNIGYSLDNETKTCKQSIKISMNLRPGLSNCYVENIGTKLNPIYSCKYCYRYYDLLIPTESGAKFCETPLNYEYSWIENPNYELEGCTEANADTTYLNNNYNCTNCSLGYISYYSRFFKRRICQNVYENITRKKDEFDSTIFDDVENVTAINGKCQNNKLFTPDNEKCYSCSNRQVGMVGCKGTCTFSIKRNNVIECEDGGCKTGYLEKTKGVCEPCDTVNKGCIECHYDENYLSDYLGLKRKRRFVCDTCEEGFLRSEDGTCHNCTELGFKNCDKCKRDINNDNDLICYKCLEGYFLTEYGECTKCEDNQVRGNGNICINCDDAEEGGIEGCQTCINENVTIKCQECKKGFVLLENNKTCLKISENEELEEFVNCQQLILDNNNKLMCTKCTEDYVLLKENNEIRCVSSNFIPSAFPNINWLCQEYANLGTPDKPKYTCNKCLYSPKGDYYYNQKIYEYENDWDDYYYRNYDYCKYICHQIYPYDTYYYKNIGKCIDDCMDQKINKTKKSVLIKMTYLDNNTAFCDYNAHYEKLENCTEATLKKDGDVIKINCTKCYEENILKYHVDTNSYICKYIYYEKNCVAKYCKTCKRDNNYFCESCLPTDYEPNPITGVCVKKTEKIPAVMWKDIFRLQMNQQRIINGRPLYGPTLMLRGLTSSQINTGHAFLIYMIFKIQYTRNNRYLEEEKKVPTICEIIDSVDETDDELNIVEYDCIGNLTEDENNELTNYKLNNLGEDQDNNNGVLSNSNLQEVIENTNIENLDKLTKPTYTLNNFLKTCIFSLDEIKNQTSENYEFNFTLKGKLDTDLEPANIEAKLALSEISDKKADCNFNIKGNKEADLSCNLNIENYKDYKVLSFKVAEIGDKENPIYLNKINEVYLLNEYKEEEPEKEPEENKKSNKTIIIIIVCCVVVAVVVIITSIILIRKNKKIDLDIHSREINNKRENYKDNFEKENTTKRLQ